MRAEERGRGGQGSSDEERRVMPQAQFTPEEAKKVGGGRCLSRFREVPRMTAGAGDSNYRG